MLHGEGLVGDRKKRELAVPEPVAKPPLQLVSAVPGP